MNFDIHILGTSSAMPVTSRAPSAQVVNVYGTAILIDCGEGTQRQLRKFHISFGRIYHIFISHLHGDHYFGLFGLLSSYALLNRTADLHIYAPAQLRILLTSSCSPVKLSELTYKVRFHDIPKNGGLLLDAKNFTVEAVPLRHSIPTYGFIVREKQRQPNIIKEAIAKFNLLIEEIVKLKRGELVTRADGSVILPEQVTVPAPKPRVYAYISDTLPIEEIVPLIKGANVLYHEATYDESNAEKAKLTYHSTARQAAEIAKAAEVESLVLGHFSATILDFDSLLAEAKSVFPNTILGYDGLKISIPFKKNI